MPPYDFIFLRSVLKVLCHWHRHCLLRALTDFFSRRMRLWHAPCRCLRGQGRRSRCCPSSPHTSWSTLRWASSYTALGRSQRWRRCWQSSRNSLTTETDTSTNLAWSLQRSWPSVLARARTSAFIPEWQVCCPYTPLKECGPTLSSIDPCWPNCCSGHAVASSALGVVCSHDLFGIAEPCIDTGVAGCCR